MSLIDAMMDECIIMNKAKVPDGQGGFDVAWSEGAEILVAIVNNTSMEARRAEKEGVTSTYTLTTKRDVILDFHEVIKRKSDGLTFRVTSSASDVVSPAVSSLDMRQVTAERWELTT